MEFTRLFDVMHYQNAKYPQDTALAEKIDGQWIRYSTAECIKRTDEISKGLYAFGIRPGDKVAIVANSRPLWNFVDLALLQLGAIVVPIYPTISYDEYRFIFKDAEIKLAFVYDKALFQKITKIQEEALTVQKVYTFNKIEGAPYWDELLPLGKDVDFNEIEKIKAGISKDDLATIIYTSGTTGTPKGVMLSHNNVISNVISSAKALPINHTHSTLSALPICHIFERMVCYLYLYVGASLHYAERVDTIADNLKEVKPQWFTTVPRLLEKVYEKIMSKGMALEGFKKKLFFWAHDLGMKYDPQANQGMWYNMQLAIANKLVFSKWREALGGNIEGIVSGAAALQPRLARIFNAAQIPVLEGYGQTESSPVIAVNQLGDGMRIGTVGPAIEGVTVKIAEDGEICIKGPNVMMGYYKRPDLTAETIDSEGWLHTGDVGTIVEGKFLKITDRKKELFKNSGGKYIAPQVIENLFKESFMVEQIMAVGENKKTVSALIVPCFANLKEWCKREGLNCKTNEEIVNSPEVHKHFAKIRDEFNKKLGEVEKVRKFILLPNEWTQETGELTPTLKLKRKVIMEKYKNEIAELYNE